MKKRKNQNFIIKLVILLILFVFLVNPSWIPFLADGTENAMRAELQNTFGIFAGGDSGAFAPAKILSALAAAVLVWLLVTVSDWVLSRASRGRKRGSTISGMVSSIVKAVGFIVGFIWVLSILGVNLGAIFASLGVASLVIGFGVQSLIEDCVTGIFIILEGQYNIGDIIVLEDFCGTVRKVSMRTTTIEDGGGNLKIINNSDIRNIQNRSNAQSLAICDLNISYDADLRKVEKLLESAFPAMYERNTDVFEAVPKYGGVQGMAESAVLLRVMVDTQEKNIFAATRRLNREMKLFMDDNGLEIPFNQLVVHNGN